MVGICPDTIQGLEDVSTSRKLQYPLYSDASMQTATEFGLAHHVDDATVQMYKEQHKIDLEAASGHTHHNLPVPAVIVVDTSNRVQFTYINPDHKVRLSVEELLQVTA